MNNHVYIFFNGHDVICPPGQEDVWSNHRNQDAAKLFQVCCESWAHHGWQPHRITSQEAPYRFLFNGRLRESLAHYGYQYWDIWFAVHSLLVEQPPEARLLLCSTDVINWGLDPASLETYLETMARESIDQELLMTQALSFQEHFTTALISVPKLWVSALIKAIADYDEGKLLEIVGPPWVSDEMIARAFTSWKTWCLCRYSSDTRARCAPLVHYARSTINHSPWQ
jgi:hypothetical protein